MPKSLDEIFDKIAQEAIEKANRVRCSSGDYRAGLRHIVSEIKVAIQASEEMDEVQDDE